MRQTHPEDTTLFRIAGAPWAVRIGLSLLTLVLLIEVIGDLDKQDTSKLPLDSAAVRELVAQRERAAAQSLSRTRTPSWTDGRS